MSKFLDRPELKNEKKWDPDTFNGCIPYSPILPDMSAMKSCQNALICFAMFVYLHVTIQEPPNGFPHTYTESVFAGVISNAI
jgi:hypothetical protein